MTFASPIWLVGLVPWAALAVWLLIGRREEARVPFVHLWPRGAAPVRTRRLIQLPPVALLCLLLAMLLAVVAAARPVVSRASDALDVTLVVDLDVTSPLDALHSLNLTPARVVMVNGEGAEAADPSRWRETVKIRSSIATLATLREAVSESLARERRPVVVLSNQKLGIDSPRLIQITSASSPQNVGITRVAARDQQVMVGVRNQSAHTSAELVVNSESRSQRQAIELPSSGGAQNYFIDLPTLGRVVSVELVVRDDIEADNRAWLVRRPTAPELELRASVPVEVARVVDAYRRLRPGADGSALIAVTTSPVDGPAAIVASDRATHAGDDPLQVADHPICANVDWTAAIGDDLRVAEPPAGEGWSPVVRRGNRVLVAARERPARQVWIGLQSETWPRHSGFVIFWTNVFDWLGHGGGDAFVSEPVQRLGGEWRRLDDLSGGAPARDVEPAPGVWGRDDGAIRALNLIDLTLDLPAPTDWRAKLGALRPVAGATSNLTQPALLASLAAALIASLTWASVKHNRVPT